MSLERAAGSGPNRHLLLSRCREPNIRWILFIVDGLGSPRHVQPLTLTDLNHRSLPVMLRDGMARLLTPYLRAATALAEQHSGRHLALSG